MRARLPPSAMTHSSETAPASEQSDKSLPQAEMLLSFLQEEDILLFRDEFQEPYIRMTVDGHREVWPVASKTTSRYLEHLFWKKKQKAIGRQGLEQVIGELEARALFDGEEISLALRTMWHEGNIWIDLCDKQWRAVCVTPAGWRIVDDPPVLFRRLKHQRPLLVTEERGDIHQLDVFMSNLDEDALFLLKVYLVTCLVPDLVHVILYVLGEQGSMKSTFSKMLRLLVDPSKPLLLTLHLKVEELVQQLSHHHFPCYDNVSYIPPSISDTLCRSSTGDGYSRRKLYTDNEDITFEYRCSVLLNGIALATHRADLLERCLYLHLSRIPKAQRKPERAIWKEFEKQRPIIFAGMLDVLSLALRFHPTIQLKEHPRMADFAEWGCAIAQAMGEKPERFLHAYEENTSLQHEEVIQANPIALAVRVMMQHRNEPWDGSPTKLLNKLVKTAEKEGIDVKQREWPRSPAALTYKLNIVKTNLREMGIEFRTERRTRGERFVVLTKLPQDEGDVSGDASGGSAAPPIVSEF